MLTPISSQTPRKGDFFALELEWVNQQPLDSQWRIVGDAIALGENLLKPGARFVHIGIVVGDNADTIEALGSGVTEDHEILDGRFALLRPAYTSPEQIEQVVAYCKAHLSEPYGFQGLLVLGLERETGLPFKAFHVICSVLGAGALRSAGIDLWPGMRTEEIAPSDYQDVMPVITEHLVGGSHG